MSRRARCRERRSSDAKPFLFNELFEVRPDFKLSLEPIQNAIPTIVIDDFLKHPEEAREVVGRAPAANWKHEKGGKNFVDYYDCRLRFPIRYPNGMIAAAQQAIRQVYQVNTRPSDASVDVNWFMQIHEKRADFAVPHNDMTDKVRGLSRASLYLNRREECSGGTAFFRFKKSGSLVLDEAVRPGDSGRFPARGDGAGLLAGRGRSSGGNVSERSTWCRGAC